MRQYYEITKVDEEKRMVYGYASTETIDAQGETVTKDAIKAAWDEYMQFGNVREMHGNSAAGVVKEYSFDDKGVFIGAEIVDDQAWAKVVKKVYKGFSIGGKKLKDGFDKVTKTITGMKLTEISLVDRPANPDALIEVFKADGYNLGDDPDLIADEPEAELAPAVEKVEAPAVDLTDETLIKSVLGSDLAKSLIGEMIAKAVADAATVKVEDAPVVSDEPSDLRKAFKALLVTEGEDIAKGVYDISRFADVLCSMAYLQECASYEAARENDGSSLPQQLADLVQQAGNVLLQMAQEEIGELIAAMKAPDGTPAVTILTDAIAMSAYAADLKKTQDIVDVVKAGARNSASDKERIQKAHDLISELGADCAVDKHDHAHDIEKMAGNLEKAAGENATLRKAYDTLSATHEAMKKSWEKSPATPKGAVLTIEKVADANPVVDATPTVDPVRKQDGSVDDVATEMKKVHAAGGRAFGR